MPGADEAETYVLLPSALVGPATWEPVAARLRAAGMPAVVADTGTPREPADALASYVEAARSADGAVVLVPHSNAGYFAPPVAAAVGAAATVYVDAALPASAGASDLAPPELYALLEPMTDDEGLLPPWAYWWGEEVAALFPDPETRRRVEDSMPRVPLSYFRAGVEVPPGWERWPNAYLAFGNTYAPELTRAETLGWPTTRLEAPHLFPVWDPPTTAEALLALRGRLG